MSKKLETTYTSHNGGSINEKWFMTEYYMAIKILIL